MDTVTLRKLAHKSVWTYGKYDGYTVKDILGIAPVYLVWAYYNLDKISFIDEILDGFASKYKQFKRIDKPGKDPDYHESYFKFEYRNMSKSQLLNLIKGNAMNGKKSSKMLLAAYRSAKSKAIQADKREILSKSSLQSMNHGGSKNLVVRKK
jgi:hypothetical protein